MFGQKEKRDAGAQAETRAEEAQAVRTIVAMLPFADKTGDARLSFASSALPHLVGNEIRRYAGISVLGHYQLADRLPSAEAPFSAWAALGQKLGASALVHGTLEKAGNDVRIDIVVEDGARKELGHVVRIAAVESVPEVARSASGEVLALVVGRPVDLEKPKPLPFDVARELSVAIAALERSQFGEAEERLGRVLAAAPDLAEASYYAALVSWWHNRPDARTRAFIDAALKGEISPAEKGFLEGLILLMGRDYEKSTAHFLAQRERFPEHRDVLYGLMESQFHGGHPGEAMKTYRALCALSPRFGLGLLHALTYYNEQADTEGVSWAMARAEVVGFYGIERWRAITLSAGGRTRDAITLLQRLADVNAHDGSITSADAFGADLVWMYAVSGDVGLALAQEKSLMNRMEVTQAAAMFGLEAAAGTEDLGSWEKALVAEAEKIPPSAGTAIIWLDLASLATARGVNDAFAERVAREIEVLNRPDGYPSIGTAVARALFGGSVEGSKFPEAEAVATALQREREKDFRGAAAAWEEALKSAGEGRFGTTKRLGLMRAKKALGDAEGIVGACRGVLTPRSVDWAWGAGIGPCLVESARAEMALGRREEAEKLVRRLRAIRIHAGPEDAVLAEADALLAAPAGDAPKK